MCLCPVTTHSTQHGDRKQDDNIVSHCDDMFLHTGAPGLGPPGCVKGALNLKGRDRDETQQQLNQNSCLCLTSETFFSEN